MREAGLNQDARAGGQPAAVDGPPVLGDHDLVLRFESLGGSGHGAEFGVFQKSVGIDVAGLLRDTDLGHEQLISALEAHLEGIGSPEHTIVFQPDHSDEWWTKDKRYWMARRSFVKVTDVGPDAAVTLLCDTLQGLRDKLIQDLSAGEKIFVFRNIARNLSDPELARLHAAVREFGPATLFYVRYADAAHRAGLVEAAGPGLLIGYVDHFAFARDNQPLGTIHDQWLALCKRAHALFHGYPAEEPEAPAAPEAPAIVPGAAASRGRRIVLVGNCQVNAMAALYKRYVACRTGDSIEAIASYQDLTPEGLAAIQQADIVVEQILDVAPRADVPTAATRRLFIPSVSAAFLWPFAGQAHPRNVRPAFLPSGPYGGEVGDSYLNRLMAAGMDPEQAADAYIEMDVKKRVNLDRMYELVMDRQRSRDTASGYKIADIIEQHFRSEQIFLTPFHPNLRVAVGLATQFFEQLGASQDDIQRMQYGTRTTPFPKDELPIHPSVCRHFGLDFITPDRRYRFMNEGKFTFREYILRYMRFEWNEALEEGLSLVRAGKPDAARERLQAAIAQSPQCAAAHNALSHILSDQGRRDEALAAVLRAVEIEPDAGPYLAHLGNLLREAGYLPQAETALRAALGFEPTETYYYIILAVLLRQLGRHDEACELLRRATELEPYSAPLLVQLADYQEAAGKADAAVDALEAAARLEPENTTYPQRLALMLGRLNRLDEAVSAARTAVSQAPDTARNRIVLSDLLLRQGNQPAALTEARLAAMCEPANAEVHGHLGVVLRQIGDKAAAERTFLRAVELAPDNAHYRHELSVVYLQQSRPQDAVRAAREAVERQPGNPHRHVHLAALLGLANDHAGAEAAQKEAVGLAPENATFRIGLSRILVQAGDLEQAEAVMRQAVALDPANSELRQQLDALLSRRAGAGRIRPQPVS